MWTFLLFFVIGLFSYLIWRRIQIFKLRSRLGLKGPPTNILFGNLHQIVRFENKDFPSGILAEWRKQYGDVYGYYMGPKLTVYVSNLEMIKDILIKKADYFIDRMQFALAEPEPSCHSLVVVGGQKWKEFRKAITPTFTASKMKQMSGIINLKIDTLINKLVVRAENTESFDIYENFQALTLDVIGQCAFGMQVHCQTDKNDPFLVDAKELFRLFDMKNFPLVQYALILPELGWIFSKLRLVTGLNKLESKMMRHLAKVVDFRKKNFQNDRSIDMLHLLLEQQMLSDDKKTEWKLTDGVIVGNAYTFLLAGYETTSTALAFTTWLLAKHPDVQKKLQDEIDFKFDKNVPVVKIMFYANHETGSDQYFFDGFTMARRKTIFEDKKHIIQIHDLHVDFSGDYVSLGPTPKKWAIVKNCVKDCQVGGVRFLRDVEAYIPVLDIHKDPEIWPEPEKFDPDRFYKNKNFNAVTWLPFGLGPRNCIGMRFAEMEYKMTLVRVLREFNILFGSDSEIDDLTIEQQSFLMHPKNGIRIKLVKRNF